jgi:hypothetical protein
METKMVALALGLTLAFGSLVGEARAASECALSIAIFGVSVDVCGDATETSREHRATRNGLNTNGVDAVDTNLVVGVAEVDSAGRCDAEADNTQGEVDPGGTNVNVSMAIC